MNEPIKAVVEEPGHVQRQPSPPKENKSCQPNSFFRVLSSSDIPPAIAREKKTAKMNPLKTNKIDISVSTLCVVLMGGVGSPTPTAFASPLGYLLG